ncbi:KAP family P-loop NTPase fold protein [Pseudomonas tohonis]|uniref:KAP family P-loop NTPase fold protein n=1 Tax=Pseudomonas tohonis TaxID=2725477 RepID=UPI0022F0BB22|nr:P-loop NTPase fold protein [Pseudomonas tohonis]
MKLVTPRLTIDDADGFQNDALQRLPFGEALSNLVIRSTDELVISLDGKWGEGKTTFVKMWQGLLSEKGIPSIYIDAFQNDYTEDAFISIASSITSYIDKNSTESEKRIEFKEKAKKVGVRLLAWGAKVGIKAATLGAIKESDIEALSEIGDEVAGDASDAIVELVNERLNAHAKESELIQSFRDSLSGLPSAIKDNQSGRLVVIIDELDRCKPSFAVEVLEKIKHLFSVTNVAFVLVMHKEQLEEAIKSVYGSNIDAHTYLQKFINIETTIPKRTLDQYNNDIDKYIKKLIAAHELPKWGEERLILDCLAPLARHFNLSLRQLEKTFTNIAIIYSTSEENNLRLIPIIIFICTLKTIKPITFNKLLYNKINYRELCNETNLGALTESTPDERSLKRMMIWIEFSTLSDNELAEASDADKESFHHLRRSLWKYNIERDRLTQFFCEKLSMFSVH